MPDFLDYMLGVAFNEEDKVVFSLARETLASVHAAQGTKLDPEIFSLVMRPPRRSWRRRLRGSPLRVDYIPIGRQYPDCWRHWRRIRWLLKDLWWTFWS